jgi:hypothetical protein
MVQEILFTPYPGKTFFCIFYFGIFLKRSMSTGTIQQDVDDSSIFDSVVGRSGI